MILTQLVFFQFWTGAGGTVPGNGGENLKLFLGCAASLAMAVGSRTPVFAEHRTCTSLSSALDANTPVFFETLAASSLEPN